MRIVRWLGCLLVLGGLSAAAEERGRTGPAEDAVALRARAFLEYVVEHGRGAPVTQWGAYEHFDVHALAHFALRRDLDRGVALLAGTLDLIERNLAEERVDPTAKWHLADLALMALLRTWFLHRHANSGQAPAVEALWDRLRRVRSASGGTTAI